jgi:hypothetical protein
MAVQTTSAGFLAWPSLEQEYLGLVTASRHVVRTGTVTALRNPASGRRLRC